MGLYACMEAYMPFYTQLSIKIPIDLRAPILECPYFMLIVLVAWVKM